MCILFLSYFWNKHEKGWTGRPSNTIFGHNKHIFVTCRAMHWCATLAKSRNTAYWNLTITVKIVSSPWLVQQRKLSVSVKFSTTGTPDSLLLVTMPRKVPWKMVIFAENYFFEICGKCHFNIIEKIALLKGNNKNKIVIIWCKPDMVFSKHISFCFDAM